MIALLQMELATEAEDVLNSLEDEADSNQGDPLSLTDSNSPCLDILLSENIPAHILAASRMPVSVYETQCRFPECTNPELHVSRLRQYPECHYPDQVPLVRAPGYTLREWKFLL